MTSLKYKSITYDEGDISQKNYARVTSTFDIFRSKYIEFKNSHYGVNTI